MNIGIDLDGVLFDSEKAYAVYAKFFDFSHKGKGVINPDELRAQNRYCWTKAQEKEFELGCLEIQKYIQVMPFAKQILQILSKSNNIFIITSRGNMFKKEIAITKKRLKEEGIIFNKAIFNANKVQECKNLNIDLMIDDYYETIKDLAENNIKCLYYADISTKKINHKNVVSVVDWADIAFELIKREIINKEDIEKLYVK